MMNLTKKFYTLIPFMLFMGCKSSNSTLSKPTQSTQSSSITDFNEENLNSDTSLYLTANDQINGVQFVSIDSVPNDLDPKTLLFKRVEVCYHDNSCDSPLYTPRDTSNYIPNVSKTISYLKIASCYIKKSEELNSIVCGEEKKIELNSKTISTNNDLALKFQQIWQLQSSMFTQCLLMSQQIPTKEENLELGCPLISYNFDSIKITLPASSGGALNLVDEGTNTVAVASIGSVAGAGLTGYLLYQYIKSRRNTLPVPKTVAITPALATSPAVEHNPTVEHSLAVEHSSALPQSIEADLLPSFEEKTKSIDTTHLEEYFSKTEIESYTALLIRKNAYQAEKEIFFRENPFSAITPAQWGEINQIQSQNGKYNALQKIIEIIGQEKLKKYPILLKQLNYEALYATEPSFLKSLLDTPHAIPEAIWEQKKLAFDSKITAKEQFIRTEMAARISYADGLEAKLKDSKKVFDDKIEAVKQVMSQAENTDAEKLKAASELEELLANDDIYRSTRFKKDLSARILLLEASVAIDKDPLAQITPDELELIKKIRSPNSVTLFGFGSSGETSVLPQFTSNGTLRYSPGYLDPNAPNFAAKQKLGDEVRTLNAKLETIPYSLKQILFDASIMNAESAPKEPAEVKIFIYTKLLETKTNAMRDFKMHDIYYMNRFREAVTTKFTKSHLRGSGFGTKIDGILVRNQVKMEALTHTSTGIASFKTIHFRLTDGGTNAPAFDDLVKDFMDSYSIFQNLQLDVDSALMEK